MNLQLPEIYEVRDRIKEVPKNDIKYALIFMYLTCGRAKEVVGFAYPNDKSGHNNPTGPTGFDARLDEYEGEEIALFNVYTQKRDGKKRVIALPLKYEEWSKPLYDYFCKFGRKERVFNFSRQKLWREGKPHFEGLTYPIEKYTTYINGEVEKTVSTHDKNFTLHALRHLRATELIEYYGFNGFQLSIYGGWTMNTSVGFSGQFDRYISLNWRSYIGRLMKVRRW